MVFVRRKEDMPVKTDDREVVLELTLPRDAVRELEALADITEDEAQDRIAKLAGRAFSTYAWIARQQAEGRVVVSLEESAWKTFLRKSRDLPGEVRQVAAFFPERLLKRAQAYFGLST